MQVCLDATRFGFGLKEAVGLTMSWGLSAFEYTFEPFIAAKETSVALAKGEKKFLGEVFEICQSNNIAVAGLNMNFCLNLEDRSSSEQFDGMVTKLACVAEILKAPYIGFYLQAGLPKKRQESGDEVLSSAVELLAEKGVKLVVRLSTPQKYQKLSLNCWQPMDPQSWREIICRFPGISLSFSPADCLWQGIDYLKLLPTFVPAIENVELVDVEINQVMIADSGLFGPLWWRYRLSGKGQVDWPQVLEALKLYGYNRSVSIHLDDEFVGDDLIDLEKALDESLKFVSPLIKG